jgi:hypothetical protein
LTLFSLICPKILAKIKHSDRLPASREGDGEQVNNLLKPPGVNASSSYAGNLLIHYGRFPAAIFPTDQFFNWNVIPGRRCTRRHDYKMASAPLTPENPASSDAVLIAVGHTRID